MRSFSPPTRRACAPPSSASPRPPATLLRSTPIPPLLDGPKLLRTLTLPDWGVTVRNNLARPAPARHMGIWAPEMLGTPPPARQAPPTMAPAMRKGLLAGHDERQRRKLSLSGLPARRPHPPTGDPQSAMPLRSGLRLRPIHSRAPSQPPPSTG